MAVWRWKVPMSLMETVCAALIIACVPSVWTAIVFFGQRRRRREAVEAAFAEIDRKVAEDRRRENLPTPFFDRLNAMAYRMKADPSWDEAMTIVLPPHFWKAVMAEAENMGIPGVGQMRLGGTLVVRDNVRVVCGSENLLIPFEDAA